MNAIETKDLTKKYKERTAVKNLNLSMRKGELFSLLGQNAAGKTTTIKMLCCLLSPTSGDATLLGNSIIKNPSKIKEIINISPQETAIAPKLSVKENLIFIAGIYGNNKKEATEKASEMLVAFSLEDVAKDKAKTLSGGMQRRLSIAMALITNPEILFLDEPTLGLDVVARRELWQTIEKLKNKVTIILTTHYLEEAVALSDRIGIMAKGSLIAVGTSNELMDETHKDTFEDAFIQLATQEVQS